MTESLLIRIRMIVIKVSFLLLSILYNCPIPAISVLMLLIKILWQKLNKYIIIKKYTRKVRSQH